MLRKKRKKKNFIVEKYYPYTSRAKHFAIEIFLAIVQSLSTSSLTTSWTIKLSTIFHSQFLFKLALLVAEVLAFVTSLVAVTQRGNCTRVDSNSSRKHKTLAPSCRRGKPLLRFHVASSRFLLPFLP